MEALLFYRDIVSVAAVIHTTCYLYLKNNNLQINTLNYCWHTGDLRVGVEEIDALQMKHLQELFFQIQMQNLFFMYVYFFANKCL